MMTVAFERSSKAAEDVYKQVYDLLQRLSDENPHYTSTDVLSAVAAIHIGGHISGGATKREFLEIMAGMWDLYEKTSERSTTIRPRRARGGARVHKRRR
jgi:hypothetical protein